MSELMTSDAEKTVMNLPRRDAHDKLRGRTRYTTDRVRPDMLHAVLLRSNVAAGRIVKLDVTAALAAPGVRAIATGADAPGLYGIGIADHPLLAIDTIRYHGEPIVAIAAETEEAARAALDLVTLEIEPLSPILTMGEALAADARLVHEDWRNYEVLTEGGARAGNIGWEARSVRGDVDAAFARTDVTIVETSLRVGRQSHVPFEPRVAIGAWENGRAHIETSTQVPWTVRNVTGRVMQLPPGRVRVTVPPVGGGFGLKFDASIEPIAALLARMTGRTVVLENTRQEEMATCLCRENAEILIRSAVTKDGEIVGREAVVLMDCGAYGGEQIFLTSMTSHTLGGNYKVGAIRLVSRAIYTNTPPNGAFRACNGVYNTFALERHTDEICAELGFDPIAFRKQNVLGDGDLGPTGQVFEADVLKPMLERMDALRDKTGTLEHKADGRLYGRATTVGTWFIFVGPSAATINMNADGSATLVTSGVEIGSGTMMQSLPQIVAGQLGLLPDQVVVREADTDSAGLDVGVGVGRTTVSIGAASMGASAEVRDKLLSVASELLQTPAEDLHLAGGRIEVKGRPGSGMTISKVVQHAESVFGPISGTGSFTARNTPAMTGCAMGHFIDALDIPVFVVHEAEVAVDPDTGHVDVLAYRVVQDVGRALNPRAIMGQVQGGVTQGLGYALHEAVTIASDGRIAEDCFEAYRLPLAQDVVSVVADLYEGAPSYGPLGAKGAGEVPILAVGAAIGCAVANATGKRVRELPLTPPRVLALIKERDALPAFPHIAPTWRANTLG